MKKIKCPVICVVLAVVLTAVSCASLTRSHTAHYAQESMMVQQGRVAEVAQKLDTKAREGGLNGVLHALQAGYYYLFMQDYDRAEELFKMAENQIEMYEERAIISATDLEDTAKAILASDMELPYKGEMFEKIMLNTMLTLNYLFKGDLEGANVEVRRAEIRQKEAEDKHQEELKKIEEQKEKEKLDEENLNSIYDQYNVLDDYAAKVINSFQNGFTYYLGGLVYELNNKYDEAYKDYYKSFSLYKNKYTLEKLVELSQVLQNPEDYEKWTGMYRDLFAGETPPRLHTDDPNGEIVVIYFAGHIPQKKEAKFMLGPLDPLPFSKKNRVKVDTEPLKEAILGKKKEKKEAESEKKSHNRPTYVAFPFYDRHSFPTGKEFLEIKSADEFLGRTEVVLDFVPIAVKALKEQLPGIAVRQMLRRIAKRETEKTADKIVKGGGNWVALFNAVTERADLRGWYELPGNIQVFRTKVQPGPVTVTLNEISDYGEGNKDNIDLEIRDNGTAFVLVQQLSTERVIHSIVLEQPRFVYSAK